MNGHQVPGTVPGVDLKLNKSGFRVSDFVVRTNNMNLYSQHAFRGGVPRLSTEPGTGQVLSRYWQSG